MRFSQKKKLFSKKKIHESGCQEVVTCVYVAEGVLDRETASRAERSVDEADLGSSDVETGKRACRISAV